MARNISTRATLRTLAQDADGGNLDPKTVTSYLSALERVFVADDVPAWSPRMRSKVALRSAPARQLVDPALACAMLRTGPERLLNDLESFGLLFESLVLRDLRVYAGPLRGWVGHYRDETGLEADAIVELGDGAWAAFEVKLGGERAIEHAAASLTKLAGRVDDTVRRRLAALAVVTATGGYAYQHPTAFRSSPSRPSAHSACTNGDRYGFITKHPPQRSHPGPPRYWLAISLTSPRQGTTSS